MQNNSVLVIVEILEFNKAPDIRYISVSSTDNSKPDNEFANMAVSTFKAEKNYPATTVFKVKNVIKFKSTDSYLKFFKNQLSDYLSSI